MRRSGAGPAGPGNFRISGNPEKFLLEFFRKIIIRIIIFKMAVFKIIILIMILGPQKRGFFAILGLKNPDPCGVSEPARPGPKNPKKPQKREHRKSKIPGFPKIPKSQRLCEFRLPAWPGLGVIFGPKWPI